MDNNDFGYVKLNLAQAIEKKGISKNKVASRAEMQRTQLNNYCKNKMQRVDMDIIARICFVLECDISDILEYVPPKE